MSQKAATYHEAFQNELEKLNPAQAEAVKQTEGPVLVVAGPGTGKTHILTARIGQILLTTDTQAQNILCLTFTDAGVRAMRQRLLHLIGPEAHRVHIYTFHSFCNGIIQENLALFGQQRLESISELEQIELSRSLLDQLDHQNPLRRGKIQVYFYEKHLRGLFQLMKSENWSVEMLNVAIDSYLQSLPSRPEYIYKRKTGDKKRGDLKEASIKQQETRMAVLKSAAALFPDYERGLKQMHRYDFADMIRWVLDAFENNPNLLRRYQEQYLYFLIDEYQDTNGAQNELIKKLTSFWDAPNLFIVGDDDQSIFEFQGARLQNLVDFYERFKEQIKVVLLQQNYRSTQAILNASKKLIDHNEQRISLKLKDLGFDKNLKAALPDRVNSKARPVVYEYPNVFQEETAILEKMEQLHKNGVAWNKMAIIYAKHQQIISLQQRLDKTGIPYQTRRRSNILDSLLIRQLRALLSYFKDEQQQAFSGDYRLFKLLHYRCFDIPALDLAKLSQQLVKIPYVERLSWREWICTSHQWGINLASKDQILKVGQWLEASHNLINDKSLAAIVERLLNGSGLLAQVMKADDRIWQVQLAKTFLDFVNEEVTRKPRLNLADLLLVLDQMDANLLALPMRKDIELEDGVHLLTAHSSKGLEFHTVFIFDAVKRVWEPSGRSGGRQFSFPDTLTLSGETYADETRRRLFYVAITRAEENLFISYAAHNAKGKAQQACKYIDEIIEEGQLEIQQISLNQDQLLGKAFGLLEETTFPQLPAMEKSAISHLLDGFQLSISAWNRYLSCPLRFFYEVVLQAPQIQRPAASYGESMHNALQHYFNIMIADEQHQFPAKERLVQFFTEEMHQRQFYFPKDEYEHRLKMGEENLVIFYDQYHEDWVVNCHTELRIQNVEIEGVPIKGVIDRIDVLNDHELRIVDYKTGSHKKDKIRSPKLPNHPEGGSYWRQLIFYKLLIENKGSEHRKVSTASISYLDLDNEGKLFEHQVKISTQEVKDFKQLLSDSYQRIMDQEFYTGCGKETCEWCQFVTENINPPGLSSKEIEALDDKS